MLRRRTTVLSVIASLGTKNYSIQSEKRCNFYLKMHQKLFGGWALALPGPTYGRAYNVPHTI